MAEIIIYTKDYCPHCVKAKTLLKSKGQEANIKEIDITTDVDLMKEMIEKSGGRRTVPQIFIGDKHVGGSDDLIALNGKGELDKMLSA